MTAELTSEEIVTKLLVSNTFVKPINRFVSNSTRNENMDRFINTPGHEGKTKIFSKYSFINENLNWGF